MVTHIWKFSEGKAERLEWTPMVAIDHAAMAAEGMLIQFLSDHGFDSTPVSEERGRLAREIAAYAIMTYAEYVANEMSKIAFPPKPKYKKI
jgi:hypothetical protein